MNRASLVRIDTLESLREHLQWGIELEHATLPPYFCALSSLDASRNPEAVLVVGSVFVEEMIHLALAANLLNAVGGRPRLDTPRMLPSHPRRLPHGDRSLELSLLPFGTTAIDMFLRLEQPAPRAAPAESDGYETIGQFYDAIEQGLRHLCAELGERAVFCGDPARQLSAGPFRHSGGRLTGVSDLNSALAALKEIVEQGEGATRSEVWDGYRDVFHPPCPGQPDPDRPRGFQPHLLHVAGSAGAGVQRQPDDAGDGGRHHVRPQDPGAEPDADARRRRHNSRPDLRVRTAGAPPVTATMPAFARPLTPCARLSQIRALRCLSD